MKVIIAEKPSGAREIARIVRATKRNGGYYDENGYAVTGAFGHLITLAMHEIYGFKGFNPVNLPIVPTPFSLVVRQNRTPKVYKPDNTAVAQYE